MRMASIPHGTVINAQGVFQVIAGGPQNIPDNNILPFFFNTPAPTNAQFDQVALTFSELDLSIPTQFRQEPAGVTQADLQNIVKNPNSVLQEALQGIAPGDQHDEQDVPAHLDHQQRDQGGRRDREHRVSDLEHRSRRSATHGPHRSKRPSGSRRSPARAANPTSSSSSTRSW